MRRFDSNDVEDFGIGLDDVWCNTDIGREYIRNYHSEESFEEQFDLIRRTAVKVAGREDVSDDEIARALYLLIQSGKIKPRKAAAAPLEEAPTDTRPRDKNGKLLGPQQIAWKEYREFSDAHSSRECELRAKTDAGYASFRSTNLDRESHGGGHEQRNTPPALNTIVNAKKPLTEGTIPTEVHQFTEKWKTMTTQQARSALSPAAMGPIVAAQNQRLFDKACELGLI